MEKMKKENTREVRNNSPASKDWSISRRTFVLFSAMSVLSEEKKTDWCSVCLLLSLLPSPLLSILACCSFLLMGFPVFLPPLFPVLSLSPSLAPCSLSLLVCLSPSEGDSAQRHTGTDWRLTLAVVLFMEAENYTFPAFLLEIRSRSGLSIQDRDPGGGETGCCYNHFLHHHFIQVD